MESNRSYVCINTLIEHSHNKLFSIIMVTYVSFVVAIFENLSVKLEPSLHFTPLLCVAMPIHLSLLLPCY